MVPDKNFRDLFMKTPVERLLLAVHEQGLCTCIEANDAAAQHFGYARADMLGKPVTNFFDAGVRDQVEKALQTCITAARPVTLNTVPKFPGGVRVQSFILNPVTNETGKIALIDIMTRPEVLDAAYLQKERDDAILLMTSMFDASGMGILVTDHHGRIVRVNETFLAEYGWKRSDVLGQEFSFLVPPEDRVGSRKLHAAFIQKGRQGSRELQILRKDGSVADIVATTALLELSEGRRFMVSTIRDITERKNMMRNLRRAKEEADTANRAKSSFLANMSHELRTPLNAIIGFSELMKNQIFGALNNPKYEEYVRDIHFSSRHLLDIINDVLDMSKIEAGKVELIESEVIIPEVFASVGRIMSDRARAGGITLQFETPPDLPHLISDQRLLRQILINLVSNAIKFSAAGKSVTVEADIMPDNHVRIVVVDEGCGIPADKLRAVQEPFGQVNDPRNYRGQGTGLGLPLARAMMELHHGRLTLESEEGQGTRVMLDFPPARTLGAHAPVATVKQQAP